MTAQRQIADPTDGRRPEQNGINIAPEFDVVGADRSRQPWVRKAVAEGDVLHDIVERHHVADIGCEVGRRNQHPSATFDRYIAPLKGDLALHRTVAGIVVPEIVVGVVGNPFLSRHLGAGFVDSRRISAPAEHQQASLFVGAKLAEIDVRRGLEFSGKAIFRRSGAADVLAGDRDRRPRIDNQSALALGAFDRSVAPIP